MQFCPQPFAHLLQWCILLLQHGVLAEVNVKELMENNIIIMMKRKRFMISKF
jgi:hypothetical protein